MRSCNHVIMQSVNHVIMQLCVDKFTGLDDAELNSFHLLAEGGKRAIFLHYVYFKPNCNLNLIFKVVFHS